MVSFKSLATLLAFGVLSATAAPAGDALNGSHLEARQSPRQVFACKDWYWQGQCITWDMTYAECKNRPAEWNDVISSIKSVHKTGVYCEWWEHANCSGERYDNQEDANLHDGSGFFADRISSIRCY
ncbi:hypothetical protein QC762_510180 [Podospora pseudocomata]|uniref:Uncharacterized protein n=1 Tax=Podospora pseudocomata TaxID=2093779 RepID=A0ABR0GDS5_9PEZI|nr:hypothetical protein QC762_510180 [Podospora pseudocomata]